MQEIIRRVCIVIIQELIKNAKESFIYHIRKCMKINSNHFEHNKINEYFH